MTPNDCELIPATRGNERGDKCNLASCMATRIPKRPVWCSDKCSRKYYAAIAENHHWTTARRTARRRDKYTCQHCGLVRTPGSTVKLEVNHKDPRNGGGYRDGCHHHQSGLETLCHKCHVKVTNEQRKQRKTNMETDQAVATAIWKFAASLTSADPSFEVGHDKEAYPMIDFLRGYLVQIGLDHIRPFPNAADGSFNA